jgi:hypothetical protein
LIVCITIFDRNILTLNEACFLQAMAEYSHEILERCGRATQKPDHWHYLLRAQRQRRKQRHDRRAAEASDERAATDVA